MIAPAAAATFNAADTQTYIFFPLIFIHPLINTSAADIQIK